VRDTIKMLNTECFNYFEDYEKELLTKFYEKFSDQYEIAAGDYIEHLGVDVIYMYHPITQKNLVIYLDLFSSELVVTTPESIHKNGISH